MKFDEFFEIATGGGDKPYDYQCRLACGERGQGEWLGGGTVCASRLINIPTGLGKTAAVVLAWLWNRVCLQDEKWPRRLVYCLPMRTLVEQTRDVVGQWIENLEKKASELNLPQEAVKDLAWLKERSPIILMGGEDNDSKKSEWDIYPENPAILIGTQDMLLSRALNRGYGMSRYRWPMHFGLLNNDCLWVMDETQLMGVGVETSAQLDGFRHLAQWETQQCRTWWMSATLEETRLETVDHLKPPSGWEKITLRDSDFTIEAVRERFEAKKPVTKASFILQGGTKKSYPKQLADFIAAKHQPGTFTLVVVNRVARAREVYEALSKSKSALINRERIALVHSRFRPVDRERHEEILFSQGGRIVIATQAVEAGVDVSARLLVTEIAPWSSLVQRFGRCNRKGDIGDAEVICVEIQPKDDKDDLLLPYTVDELKMAQGVMTELKDVGPQSLAEIRVQDKMVIRPVLRRRDLIDLFDTTPDLCGQDLDISRYVRNGEDSDVQFFWRAIPKNTEPTDEAPPARVELCRVSLGEGDKFIKKNRDRVWQWNSLHEAWEKTSQARPGGVYLIDAANGGYDDDLGWTGDAKSKVTPLPVPTREADAQGKDLQTFNRSWILLSEHTDHVVAAIDRLTAALRFDVTLTGVFHSAARWHDVGKAHSEFQKALRCGTHLPPDANACYAKSKNPYNPHGMNKERCGFRHELASALAWLSAAPEAASEKDLIAYIIAAHHGKIRLSIRALPDEKGDRSDPNRLFARGVWDKDVIPTISGLTNQPISIDLSLMQMGEGAFGPSWLSRMIGLRDQLGPFRMAYLETILRAADMRASADETRKSV